MQQRGKTPKQKTRSIDTSTWAKLQGAKRQTPTTNHSHSGKKTNTPGLAEAPERQKSKHQPHRTKGTETPRAGGSLRAPHTSQQKRKKERKKERKRKEKKDRPNERNKERKKRPTERTNKERKRIKIAPHASKRHTKRPNPQRGQTLKRKTKHQPSAEAAEGP